jgi:hypothetical protein
MRWRIAEILNRASALGLRDRHGAMQKNR